MDGVTCDDGDFSIMVDICQSGVCVGEIPLEGWYYDIFGVGTGRFGKLCFK